ncbi:MAG TPA: hypothetical protein VFS21_16135 [Roseiflexaceae bacterium]|nr:hypothetical protein [Roseiflexaceae bacterium]
MLTTETNSSPARPSNRIALQIVPSGLFFLVRGFDGLVDTYVQRVGLWLGIVYLIVSAALIISMYALPFWINRFYDRLLGPLESPAPSKHNDRLGWLFVPLLVVLLVASWWIQPWIDRQSFDVLLVFFGILTGWLGWTVMRRWYYPALGGLVLLIGLLPLTGIVSMAAYRDETQILHALVSGMPGIVLMIGGLIEHVRLMRQARNEATLTVT